MPDIESHHMFVVLHPFCNMFLVEVAGPVGRVLHEWVVIRIYRRVQFDRFISCSPGVTRFRRFVHDKILDA
jgi:hypothetical protein